MTSRTDPHARRTRLTRGSVALALAAFVAAGASACSGDGEDGDTATSAPEPTAEDRLDQAHGVLIEAGTVALTLTGSELPEDLDSYIISAEGSGTMDPPAFDGTITATVAGVQADIPTVALDGELWVKLPYVPTHVNTDPADLGVPDPATLFDPEDGLVGLLRATDGAEFGERSRAGAEIVQQVEGTLPGQIVTDLLSAGDPDADFEVTYGLVEESWQVRSVEITGPFYPPTTSTYTVTLDAYGEPVTVTQP